MKPIKNLGCKAKFLLKNTFKNYIGIANTILAILGVLLTVGECCKFMFDSNIVFDLLHRYAIPILIFCIICGFLKNKTPLKYEYFLKGTDVKLNIQVTDVLKTKNAIIIPTNTTFDTKMEDEFISVNSVQGQFQELYFKNNLSTLDDLLEKGLKGCEFVGLNRTGSKNKKYPIGTVSKITHQGQHYYFVAIADINEYGKPVNTKFENIQLALEGVWSQLENKGHIENLAIPLLGTGRAGIKEASRKKVIEEIIFFFVASAKERKITEELQICIHPLDLAQKDLNLEELDEYLRYMCQYRYIGQTTSNEGSVIEF